MGDEEKAKGLKKTEAPTLVSTDTFEENLQKLEDVVRVLEEGKLPLGESLALYEEGIDAYRRCQDLLERADVKVKKLVETLEGELKEEPLEHAESG